RAAAATGELLDIHLPAPRTPRADIVRAVRRGNLTWVRDGRAAADWEWQEAVAAVAAQYEGPVVVVSGAGGRGPLPDYAFRLLRKAIDGYGLRARAALTVIFTSPLIGQGHQAWPARQPGKHPGYIIVYP